MDIQSIGALISTVGFPIASALGIGYVAYIFIKRTMEQNQLNMEQLLQDSKDRENNLFKEIQETREINNKAIETIAKYSEKLDVIHDDIKNLKLDITYLTGKVDNR